MSTKTKETLTVISQEEIGRDIYSLWLQTDHICCNCIAMMDEIKITNKRLYL